jgi:glycosyltransferase involved in cell wall biosynthesis
MILSNPLVSIISPTYNHEKYISGCIESVLNQTYDNWEMIIVDDGSTDRSASIAEDYSHKDSRITLLKQANVGIFQLSKTYNKALELSKGEYIAILECDDVWEANKLELQVIAMEKDKEIVLCWGKTEVINSDRTAVYSVQPDLNSPVRQYFDNEPIGSILNAFLFQNCIPALTILIRRSELLRIGGFIQNNGLPLVDLPTLYELSLRGKFKFLPITLGGWRIYAGQVTKTYPVEMTKGFYQLALQFFRSHPTQIPPGITEKIMIDHYEKRLIVSFARSGRYKLIRKEFKSARKDYWNALFLHRFSEPVWKLRALTGLIFSFFHADVEGLSKLLGKSHYSKQ